MRRLALRSSTTLLLCATPGAAIAAAGAGACASAPAPQTTLSRDLRLPAEPRVPEGRGAVIGVVADATTGFPVVGAAVYFTSDPLGGGDPPPALAGLPSDSTDGRGAFVLAPLAPGTYTVVARHLAYLSGRHVVTAHAGRVDTVVVRLREQVRLTR